MIERLKMKVSEVKKLNVSYTIHLSVINILAHIHKNTGVGCHFLLQGSSSALCLLHLQADCTPLSHLGSPVSIHKRRLLCIS